MTLRGQHEELRAWAKEPYAKGRSFHEVISEVYGVDLPLEAYVFHRSRPRGHELPVDRWDFPWELIEMAGPRYVEGELSPHYQDQEAAELVRDPDFLPLMVISGGETEYDGHLVGYSIERLGRGDTTISGHLDDPREGDTGIVKVFGPSLLAVLHAWMSDYHRMAKATYEHPSNRRRGSDIDVVSTLGWLKAITTLQRKLGEQRAALEAEGSRRG